MRKDVKNRKKLERIVHPWVKKEIVKTIKTVKARMIVIEVPLLYESKMDNLFDVVIAVDVSKEKQLKLLTNRNPETAKSLLEINANHQFDANKEKADYLIENDADLNKLKEKTQKIINELQCRLD